MGRAFPGYLALMMAGSDLLGVAMIVMMVVMMGAMLLLGRSLFRHWRRH
jgi:hypothetical protein